MATHYRTIVPNGHGGGTTYRDHIVNPATREDAYAVAARIPGAYVQSSTNGVTGWEDDAPVVAAGPTSAPISSQAGLASIRGGIAATVVPATAPGHFPCCPGCNGECGV